MLTKLYNIKAENPKFFLLHSHLKPSLVVHPFEFLDEPYSQNQSPWTIRRWRFPGRSLRRFDTVPACDRHDMDRQTDGRTNIRRWLI